jgi:hypothetical protein
MPVRAFEAFSGDIRTPPNPSVHQTICWQICNHI